MSSGTVGGRYVAVPHAVYAGLQSGEGVIVDAQTALYFGLNKTAAFLWQSLKERGDATPEDLVQALVARFEVGPDDARRDVDAFLTHAVSLGLAAHRPAPASSAA